MRTFANLFLFFFVADGLLSSCDDLLNLTLGFDGLVPLRSLNALGTLLLAVPLFFALGIDRRLPKRVFLPLLAYLLWATPGCWPLDGLLQPAVVSLCASLLQLLLGILVLAYLYKRSGTSIQLTAEDFSGTPFSLANTLGYFGGVLLTLPLVLTFVGLSFLNQQLITQTAGFMRIGPSGLYLKDRTYQKGAKEVRLAAMMHIGEQDYFSSLAQSVNGPHTIVLAEGVSDREGLLTSRFDYGELGSILGLSTQQVMDFHARRIELKKLEQGTWHEDDMDSPHIAMADVDLSSFSPLTIEFLNVLGRLITSRGTFEENLTAYNAWLEKHDGPELYPSIMSDILDKRNATLIHNLKTALQYFDTVVIPWGAMHMPALEESLRTQGFMPVAEQERLSLSFANLHLDEIAARFDKETSPSETLAQPPPSPPQEH